jgi:hypothetical protein
MKDYTIINHTFAIFLNNVIIYNFKFFFLDHRLPSPPFWLSCLGPLAYCFQTPLNYLTFQYFDIERRAQ